MAIVMKITHLEINKLKNYCHMVNLPSIVGRPAMDDCSLTMWLVFHMVGDHLPVQVSSLAQKTLSHPHPLVVPFMAVCLAVIKPG